MAVYFKIIEKNKPGSKDGEKLYYATTVISGKTDFYDLCSKIHKLSRIDTKTISEVLTYCNIIVKEEMKQGRAIQNIDNSSIYIQITSKAKKNKSDVNMKDYSKREIIIKPGSTLKKFFDNIQYIEKKS